MVKFILSIALLLVIGFENTPATAHAGAAGELGIIKEQRVTRDVVLGTSGSVAAGFVSGIGLC